MAEKKAFTILGAGVVGLCCAVSLQRNGHQVILVDRLDPGMGTSFGNAGLIQIDAVVPIAMPGILRSIPGMLLDPKGPLVVRWRYLHKIAPWLLKFVLAARQDSVEKISLALASLLDRSNEAWIELVDAVNAQDVWRQSGELHVYRRKEAWDAAQPTHELRRGRGSQLVDLTVHEMRQLEPALSPNLYGGVFTPNANSITYPLHLSQRLFEYFRKKGGQFIKENVRYIQTGEDGTVANLITEKRALRVESLVVAAGAFSKSFTKSTGAKVPLDTERGYHLWLPDPGVEMRRPIVVGDHHFGIVPMTGGIRLAGTAEFAGLDLPPYWQRADILADLAEGFVPGLNAAGAKRWMGYRPSLPDSLPVLGKDPERHNLYWAFGHGHLGLTMAAITGKIIAELASGNGSEIDLSPFRIDRFI
jgi:glycine/D-amino acid oxidase-like deaminating enzyme